MADMQAGIGPFLGVFLQQRGWATGSIGLVMTLGGVAGMMVTAPAGALVDATHRKRLYVILSGLFTVLASSLIWVSQDFWVIAGSQIATAIAGAAIGPAVAGIGAGLQSVAVPGLVARILNGTGRVNVGQGAVMTVQGIGASLSPALGGAIAQAVGYRITFVVLGAFALGSLALWLAFRSLLRPACDNAGDSALHPA
jgi:MFS family permease